MTVLNGTFLKQNIKSTSKSLQRSQSPYFSPPISEVVQAWSCVNDRADGWVERTRSQFKPGGHDGKMTIFKELVVRTVHDICGIPDQLQSVWKVQTCSDRCLGNCWNDRLAITTILQQNMMFVLLLTLQPSQHPSVCISLPDKIRSLLNHYCKAPLLTAYQMLLPVAREGEKILAKLHHVGFASMVLLVASM